VSLRCNYPHDAVRNRVELFATVNNTPSFGYCTASLTHSVDVLSSHAVKTMSWCIGEDMRRRNIVKRSPHSGRVRRASKHQGGRIGVVNWRRGG
jgi:hypothetical protein